MAKKLTEKMEKKGLVTRKEIASFSKDDDHGDGDGDGGGGGGDSDYEIREDGVELTEKDVVRRKTGTWATVAVKEGGDAGQQ